jgi:hypothetical protein
MAEDTVKSELAQPEEGQQRRVRYNQAVRKARLVTILLSSLEFKVSREVLDDSKENSVSPHYGGHVKQVAFDPEEGAVLCTIQWTVDMKYGRKRFVKCAAEYDVGYEGLSGCDEDTIKLLAEYVARPASYAYFRAMYANLDWSAELRSPPLPVVKFQPKV